MKFRLSTPLIAALALLGGLASYALGQTIVVPQVLSLGQQDLVQVLPGGQAVVGNQYYPAPKIGGVEAYSYQIPVTAFSITVANGVDYLYLNPAGTLATGTLTMMASPSDGQRFCLQDTQTQTAITIQANTGQTLASGTFGMTTPTALVANTKYCWLYIGSLSTWTRTS